MNDSMIEHERPIQAKIERNPSLNNILTASDIVVSRGFRNLVSEKAKEVAGVVRRNIGKASLSAAGVSMILSSGCGNTEQPVGVIPNTSEPTITTITPFLEPAATAGEPTLDQIPKPETKPFSKPSTVVIDYNLVLKAIPKEMSSSIDYAYMNVSEDIKVAIDKTTGLPIKYISSNGDEMYFDAEKIKSLRRKAIASGQSEIIGAFRNLRIGLPTDSTVYLKEHPKTENLPNDVLSEEELRAKGVNIIQADSTKLYIRKRALEKDGPLADFDTTNRELTIVCVDGPIDDYFLQDTRYDAVRKSRNFVVVVADSPEAWRDGKINLLRQYLDSSLEQIPLLKGIRDSQRKIVDVKNRIQQYRETIYLYSNMDNVQLEEVYRRDNIFINGFYYSGEDPTIFINVDAGISKFSFIYFDQKGILKVDSREFYDRRYRGHLAKSTYPDPESFHRSKKASVDNGLYLYGSQSVGFALRHELNHDQLIQQQINQGKEPNYSEYDTDVGAMRGIKEAWEKWVNSEYTDNSGYDFVFSLPEEQGGGYVLTKSIASKKEGPSAI